MRPDPANGWRESETRCNGSAEGDSSRRRLFIVATVCSWSTVAFRSARAVAGGDGGLLSDADFSVDGLSGRAAGFIESGGAVSSYTIASSLWFFPCFRLS